MEGKLTGSDEWTIVMQLLLEAPEDIMCFKFCPTNPDYIAGGCISGQVVLWDIAQYADRLRQSRSAGKGKDTFSALVTYAHGTINRLVLAILSVTAVTDNFGCNYNSAVIILKN